MNLKSVGLPIKIGTVPDQNLGKIKSFLCLIWGD
jgi:hypothetical protein